eukprot:gene19498-26161_t
MSSYHRKSQWLQQRLSLLAQEGIVAPEAPLIAESPIAEVLESLELMDEHVRYELQQGDEYWRMERYLCSHLLAVGVARPEGGGVEWSLDDVLRTHESKSFDYRVLHYVLQRLEGCEPEKVLLSFLRVDELLVDIGDDLTDYEVAFVFLYGREAELKLVERIASLEAEHSKLLHQLPKAVQEQYWRRHGEASATLSSGSWIFPQPIFNERAFRETILQGN